MERVLHVHNALNAFQTVFTVPAGHKYEVLQCSPSNGAAAARTWYMARDLGGGVIPFTDHVAIPAGDLDATRRYESLVFYAGDKLLATFNGAGAATGLATVVDYVDVDYTT